MGNFYKNLLTNNQSFGNSVNQTVDNPQNSDKNEDDQDQAHKNLDINQQTSNQNLSEKSVEISREQESMDQSQIVNERNDSNKVEDENQERVDTKEEKKPSALEREVNLRLEEYGRKKLLPVKKDTDESDMKVEEKEENVVKEEVATTKQSKDSLQSAKERYLARKRARDQDIDY
eukprot:TRINITY_DN12316_c0_g1_i1.p2 TRINITY_DN12316_c0_g1~~TRINITY_DN12316_c0_g1_i1.p2  ORF type:complete len:175 (-),score=40.10 TRINITY_DN12316_c0_g1_i1:72-596(-)